MLVSIIFYVTFGWILYWYQTIDFEKYKQSIDKIQNYFILSLNTKNTAKQVKTCEIISWNQYYIVSPNCLINQDFEQLSFQDIVNHSWNYIEGFTDWYDIKNNISFYLGAKPIFDKRIRQNLIYLKPWYYNNIVLKFLDKKGYYIKIPKEILAAYILYKDYKFYISTKDLSNRWECRKKNYLIAMNILDNLVLKPNERFNFNIPLSQVSDYCKGDSKREYLFYAGVCGASSQLFRNALINPYLDIVKRYNHSAWYVYFYDNIIRWDDASMYQMYKQFVIQNISDYPVYFKKFEKGNNIFLVSIIPQNNLIDKISVVIKWQTWKLQARVSKLVFDKFKLEYLTTRKSRYWRLSFER